MPTSAAVLAMEFEPRRLIAAGIAMVLNRIVSAD
jgi:hypothetical protein